MIERTADKSGDNGDGHEGKLKVECVADSFFQRFSSLAGKAEEEELDDELCGCSMSRNTGKTTAFDDPSFIIWPGGELREICDQELAFCCDRQTA